MKRMIFWGSLVILVLINTAWGSVKISYYDLSSIEADRYAAINKVAHVNLKIIAQKSINDFVGEDSSGHQISLDLAKAKVSPEIVKRRKINVGEVYGIVVQVSDVRFGAERIGISGNVLAIGFPHEMSQRIVHKRQPEGGRYVWDEGQQRYVLKSETEKKEIPQERGRWVWDESQQRYVLQVEPEKKEVPPKEKKADEVIHEANPKASEVQLVPLRKSTLPERPIEPEGKTIHSDWDRWTFNGNQWRVADNILVGGEKEGNGSVWLEHCEEPVSVEFDYYTDNIDSEAILFIYGNGREEKDGYSFTLNPNWSAIRKNSFKECLAVSKDGNFKLKPNKWYKIKVVVTSDGTIKFSVDRTVSHGNVLVASDNSYTSGAIGFMVWWQATGKRYIKNIKIERLLSRKIVVALMDKPFEEKIPTKIDKSRVVTRTFSEKRPIIPLIKDPTGIAFFVLIVSIGLIVVGKLIV